MAECDACGRDSDRLLYTCNECGRKVCSDCRLPENHLCGVRDRVDEPRQWHRGTASNTQRGPVNGKDARAECKSEDCTNTSDVGSPFCPQCLYRRDREQASPREQFGKTDCQNTACSNVAGYGERYCLDCRRKAANSSSSPAVETVDGSPYNSAPTDVDVGRRAAYGERAKEVLLTAFGVVLLPLRLATRVLRLGYDFFTSPVGFALLSVGIVVLAVGPLGLVSINADSIDGAVANLTDYTADAENPSTQASGRTPWNDELVERYFIMFLNRERAERGLQNVSERAILAEMGEAHSEHMIANDYFDHTQPDGTTVEDRYRERGLLPECRIPTEDGGYYPGAENLAKTHVETNVVTDDGETVYLDSERDLAKHLVSMWMNSRGHRKAMLVHSADEAGLGLAFDGDAVYASLELC